MAFEGNNPGYPPVPNFQPAQPQPNPVSMGKIDLPDQFNPEYISADDASANPGLSAARTFLALAQSEFGTINRRRETVDVYATQAANEREVEQLVGKAEKKLWDGFKAARDQLDEGTAKVRANIASMANLKPDDYAPEIRAAFKAMPLEQREAALSEAVDNLDTSTLAAVLDAPTITTGLLPELRAAMKGRFLQLVCPDHLALLEKHHKAASYLDNAEKLIGPTVVNMYGGTGKHKEAQRILAEVRASYGE
jgi:hypothetical protein